MKKAARRVPRPSGLKINWLRNVLAPMSLKKAEAARASVVKNRLPLMEHAICDFCVSGGGGSEILNCEN